MAKVLILSLVFRPDNVSTAHLMADLAEDLRKQGHEVAVITTEPHYNPDASAFKEQPLTPCLFGLLKRSEYCGATVYHTWMPAKGRNIIYRIITWLGFHVISTIVGLFVSRRHVVLCPSPPLTIALSAWLLAIYHRAPFIYNVQEIYPDVAINLGVVSNRVVIRALYGIERFVYDKATAVTVISPRMQARLIEKGVDSAKVKVIPNSVDITGFSPEAKNNEFSRAHGLHEKFVISYAGNMGKPQHLEALVHTAALFRQRTDICFLFMGNGSEREALQQTATYLNLKNVLFLAYQSYSVMPMAYAAANVSYVPQALGTSNDGIPSKVYRILAAGRAVLACTDRNSDLAALINQARAGIVVTSSAPRALAEAVEKLVTNPDHCAEMGRNGRAHVVENYDRRAISRSYGELIDGVVARSR